MGKNRIAIRVLSLLLCLVLGVAGCSVEKYRTILPTTGTTAASWRTTRSTTGPAQVTGETSGTADPSDGPAQPVETSTPVAAATNPPTASGTVPTAVATVPVPTAPDAGFDGAVLSLLGAGLDAGSRQIELSPVLSRYPVSEAQVPAVISRIQGLYHDLLGERPDCYYLDGSNTLHYELQSSVSGTALSGIFMDVGTRDPYDSWSAADMAAARAELISIADGYAALAVGQPVWEQMRIIHDELVRRVSYDTTYSQVTNHAAGALLDGSTLCQGYAQAYQLILQRLGLPVRIISGTAKGVSHAWNLVTLDGTNYHVDVTFDDPVSAYDLSPVVFHSHFLRSDTAMRETHQWMAADFPACPDDGAQYHRSNGLTSSTREELQSRVLGHFGSPELDLYDTVNDTLELLYTGADVPNGDELNAVFLDALSAAGVTRAFSYSASMEKGVALLVLFRP